MFNVIIDDVTEKFPEETKKFCKLFIEKEARENILAYLTNESLINTPEYNLLWLEYLTLITDIQNIRKEFFNNIVLSYIPKDQNFNNLFWDLDYDKGELRIYEQ